MFVALYVGLPCVLVLPPTLLMGFSFPILQRVVQTSLARIGRRVGVLLVANVAGSMVARCSPDGCCWTGSAPRAR